MMLRRVVMRMRRLGSRAMASSMLPVVVVEMAFDEGDVRLLDGASAEGFAEFGVGEIVFGDEDDAGGFFVEAMDDAGAEDVAALRERLAAAEERVDERAGVVSGAGVDDHAGGLVDGEDVVVFVEGFERDGFGFGADRRARLGFDGDAVAAAEFVRGLCAACR